MENKQAKQSKSAKRQERLNTLAVWLMILLLGVGLGYGWRMKQLDQNARFTHQAKIQNELTWQQYKATKPYEILGTNKPAHLQ